MRPQFVRVLAVEFHNEIEYCRVNNFTLTAWPIDDFLSSETLLAIADVVEKCHNAY
jgi:hypothetical protein